MSRASPLARVVGYLTNRGRQSTRKPLNLGPGWQYSGLGYLAALGPYWFGKEHEEQLQEEGPKLIAALSDAIGRKYPNDPRTSRKTLERLVKLNTSLGYLIPSGNIQRVAEDLKGDEGHLINAGSACGVGPLYVASCLPVDVDGFDGDVCGLFMGERLKKNPLLLPAYEATIYSEREEVLGDVIGASKPFLELREACASDADSLSGALQEVFRKHNLDIDAVKRTRFRQDPSALYTVQKLQRECSSQETESGLAWD